MTGAAFFALAYEVRLIHACLTMQRIDAKRESPHEGLKGKGKTKKRAGQLKTVVVTPGAEQAQTRSPFWRHRQVQAKVHPRLAALLSLSLPFSAFRLPLLLFLLPPRALACNRADFEIEITWPVYSAHRESGWFLLKISDVRYSAAVARSLTRSLSLSRGL